MHFQGRVYRALVSRWLHAPLSGEGARRYGGRFNPPGTAALYTSLSPSTARLEIAPATAAALCVYEVDAEPVFNALDSDELAHAGINENELASVNWRRALKTGAPVASHLLATRLIDEGFVGMLVKSFAQDAMAEDANLVLWRWNEAPSCRIRVVE